MNETFDPRVNGEVVTSPEASVPEPAPVVAAVPEPPNPHAEAGRKGAQRVHELIHRGRLYEQEHGLKRGRQRLRQLIAEGKLYEQEHGLGTRKRVRRPNREQVLRRLVEALVRIARPSYRRQLERLLAALEAPGDAA